MTIRLNGSTSGYVEIDAPAAAGSNTLVLPTNNGSSGDYLRTDGSGGLSWVTPAAGLFESYALICDQKASSADGGTFTSGAWRTRDLNTEISDADSIVSIASNQFTLAAGSYLIRWSAPAYRALYHQTRLYDVTNTAAVQLGSSAYNSNADSTQGNSFGSARVAIAASTTYEIQHRSDGTQATFGFGVGTSGNAFDNTIYTIVEIYREA